MGEEKRDGRMTRRRFGYGVTRGRRRLAGSGLGVGGEVR